MSRKDIYSQITEALGFVTDSFAQTPDGVLEQWWTSLAWTMTDTKLSARDKALVGMGAAAATHCQY